MTYPQNPKAPTHPARRRTDWTVALFVLHIEPRSRAVDPTTPVNRANPAETSSPRSCFERRPLRERSRRRPEADGTQSPRSMASRDTSVLRWLPESRPSLPEGKVPTRRQGPKTLASACSMSPKTVPERTVLKEPAPLSTAPEGTVLQSPEGPCLRLSPKGRVARETVHRRSSEGRREP